MEKITVKSVGGVHTTTMKGKFTLSKDFTTLQGAIKHARKLSYIITLVR